MVHRLLLLVLLACAGTAAAAELGFAHYAPGAGPVLLLVDNQAPVSLEYKDYVDVARYTAGSRHLRALRPDGSVLAEGTLELQDSDRYIVIVAGNGSDIAPFEFRLATDHNRVFTVGMWSLQDVNLAVIPNAAGSGIERAWIQDGCRANPDVQPYGYGTRPLDGREAGSGISSSTDRKSCLYSALDPRVDGATTLAQVLVAPQPGERLRVVFIGDGAAAPYEMIVLNQGVEPQLPVMAADASIEGLWSIDGQPNTGLQISFNRENPPESRISGVYFGFEASGAASWRTLEKARLIEYVGGNVEGTRAAVGFDRATAFITVHSCTDMSLFVLESGLPSSRLFAPTPRNTVRLRRLFPPVCPPATLTGEEVQP